MKHIELRMLAIQDWVANRNLYIYKISSEENMSDLLTKPLTAERSRMLAAKCGLDLKV